MDVDLFGLGTVQTLNKDSLKLKEVVLLLTKAVPDQMLSCPTSPLLAQNISFRDPIQSQRKHFFLQLTKLFVSQHCLTAALPERLSPCSPIMERALIFFWHSDTVNGLVLLGMNHITS